MLSGLKFNYHFPIKKLPTDGAFLGKFLPQNDCYSINSSSWGEKKRSKKNQCLHERGEKTALASKPQMAKLIKGAWK